MPIIYSMFEVISMGDTVDDFIVTDSYEIPGGKDGWAEYDNNIRAIQVYFNS